MLSQEGGLGLARIGKNLRSGGKPPFLTEHCLSALLTEHSVQ